MKESDISVKQLALDLIFVITNESNVTSIIKELFNYLLAATDENFLKEMTYKVTKINTILYFLNKRYVLLLTNTRQIEDGK